MLNITKNIVPTITKYIIVQYMFICCFFFPASARTPPLPVWHNAPGHQPQYDFHRSPTKPIRLLKPLLLGSQSSRD